jgi:hypothetical protein
MARWTNNYWTELCRNAGLNRLRFRDGTIEQHFTPWQRLTEQLTWNGRTEEEWRYEQIVSSLFMALYEKDAA